MNHFTQHHQNSLAVIDNNEQIAKIVSDLITLINNINDDIILKYYHQYSPDAKGLSIALNALMHDLLVATGWNREVRLYKKCDIDGTDGKIDFVHKSGLVSLEISFNNNGSLSGIIEKLQQSVAPHPTIEKNTHATLSILICGTSDLRKYGGLDGAAITYKSSKAHLFVNAHNNLSPLILIGLDRPETFNMKQEKIKGKRNKVGTPIPRID